jgi:nucleoside phosphorylase
LKVLVVDDEYEKLQLLNAAISEAAMGDVRIEHASTAQAARLLLRRETFDLMLVDLLLPSVVGDARRPEGGFDFFDAVLQDLEASLPTEVLFITARDELIETSTSKAIDRGAMLCQFGFDRDDWRQLLIGRVKYLAKRTQREARGDVVDIALITALLTPELDAILDLPYGWQQQRFKGEALSFYRGTIDRTNAYPLSIVAATAGRKGMPASAALATKIALTFRPRFLVMLGICAGVKSKTSIGDVVVGDPTWDWGSGKLSQDDRKQSVFLAAPIQRPLDTQVASIAQELSNDARVCQGIVNSWSGEAPPTSLRIHVGPMASGASVIADDKAVRDVMAQHRELLAVEMEAYAVMAAAEYCGGTKPIAFAAKSVCDFADPDKGDGWQRYAAYTSAAFLDKLVRHPAFGVSPTR